MSFSSGSPVPPAPRLRPWMIVAPAAVLLTVAISLFALNRMPLPAAAPIAAGDAVQISVIQPAEPEVAPGERMEVGELVDGYAHAPIPAAAPQGDVYEADYATAWLEPVDEPAPVGWRRSDAPVVAPTAPQPSSASTINPYGFDAPRPDYDAARRARQERLDQIQAEASERSPLDADTAFY